MLNFLEIEMFLVKQSKKNFLKEYSEEDQKKLFVVKPIYQRS